MTFKIVDGREHFYQWDLNRQIIVDDPAIKEVHFCNRVDNCSLVVEVVNGVANVPNILLQTSFDIRVFAYDGFATRFEQVFEVKARTRPADYVYEETDILSVRQLEEDLRVEAEELRNEIDERLTDATAVIDTRLSEAESTIDTRVSVAEAEISERLAAAEAQIDGRLKEVEDGLITDGFATTEYVDEVFGNIEFPDENNVVFVNTDTTGAELDAIIEEGKWPVYKYYSPATMVRYLPLITRDRNYYNFAAFSGNTPSGTSYYEEIKFDRNTNTWGSLLNGRVGIDTSFLNDYYPKTQTYSRPEVDSKISNHNHDSKYAAKDHTHSNYTTYAHVSSAINTAIANLDIPEPDLTGYATEEWVLNTTPSRAAVNDLSNFVVDLNTYKADKDHTHAEYAAKEHTHSQYLTAHQSLANYYNKSEVDNLIDNVEVDLTGYATEGYVNEAINNIEIPDDMEVIELDLGAENDNVFVSKEIASRIDVNPEKCIIKVSSSTKDNITSTYYRFNKQTPSSDSYTNMLEYSAIAFYSTTIKPSVLRIKIIYVTDGGVSHGYASLYTTTLTAGQTIDTDNFYTKTETYSKAEVDEAIANIDIPESGSGGGASYTFTDGLTETDGTVTNDFYTSMRVNAEGNAAIINIDDGGTVDSAFNNGTSRGSLIVCDSYRSSWTDYPTVEVDMSKGVIAFGNVTGYTGGMSDRAMRSVSSQGVLMGGYATGKTHGAIYAYTRGSVVVGIADDTTGPHKVSHYGSSALGRSLQSTTSDQFLVGRCNSTTDMSKMAFIIGNGTNNTTRSNALTVDKSGNLVAAGTVTPTGADYAEYFEFEDGNPNKEDRIGYLVELINGKIRFANGTDIIGATSGSKGVIGDAEEMNWHGKYERDEFGRYIYEDVSVVNGKGTEDEYTEVIHTKKISANYDPNKAYTPRSSRPEWAPVGLLGKVLVRHDGTLSAGDYVKAINGIASKSEEKTNIRVLEVVSENVIRVLIK